MKTKEIFGQRLRKLRKEKKITQTELANALNISQKSYSNWENGKTKPTLETMARLAIVLQTSADYLLGLELLKEREEI